MTREEFELVAHQDRESRERAYWENENREFIARFQRMLAGKCFSSPDKLCPGNCYYYSDPYPDSLVLYCNDGDEEESIRESEARVQKWMQEYEPKMRLPMSYDEALYIINHFPGPCYKVADWWDLQSEARKAMTFGDALYLDWLYNMRYWGSEDGHIEYMKRRNLEGQMKRRAVKL
jgi:hypothetical protein